MSIVQMITRTASTPQVWRPGRPKNGFAEDRPPMLRTYVRHPP